MYTSAHASFAYIDVFTERQMHSYMYVCQTEYTNNHQSLHTQTHKWITSFCYSFLQERSVTRDIKIIEFPRF